MSLTYCGIFISFMPPLSPFSLARQFRQRAKEERKARGRKQNERQPKRTNQRTNSFCTCLTFHCSAAGAAAAAANCQIGKGQSAKEGRGKGVRKVAMCAQGCHQWQQPSNVARKPTRCSIHFRFGLASISLSIYPPPLPSNRPQRGMLELSVNLTVAWNMKTLLEL